MEGTAVVYQTAWDEDDELDPKEGTTARQVLSGDGGGTVNAIESFLAAAPRFRCPDLLEFCEHKRNAKSGPTGNLLNAQR